MHKIFFDPKDATYKLCKVLLRRFLKAEGYAVSITERVTLRPVLRDDLPRLYDQQLDPESNRMAGTIPHTAEAFYTNWAEVLDTPGHNARAVLLDGETVGYVCCFPLDDGDYVGYWLDRLSWGKGIASRALQLLLCEVTKRPLIAIAATSNGASIRVLQKCGFVVEQVRYSPASKRYLAGEETVLVLH